MTISFETEIYYKSVATAAPQPAYKTILDFWN